jgi:hypothetical protein
MPDDAGFREVFRGDVSSIELAAALLEDHGITTHRRFEQAGVHVTGLEAPFLPGRQVILLVPSIAYDEAKEFLERFEQPEPDYMTELSHQVQENRQKRRGAAAVILIILFAPLVIALVSMLVVVVGSLFK